VSIAILHDRLEIWSHGTLPFGLKPEDRRGPHGSKPRNPLITGAFYRRGLVEEWGRGTEMIVRLCPGPGTQTRSS
jgi:ATP-dependent DNA helicase RecG